MTRIAGLRQFVRRSPALRPLRMARLQWIAKTSGHEDWLRLIGSDVSDWRKHRKNVAGKGPKVLIATGTGGHFGLNAIDRMLSVALTLRGADVSVLLCDGALQACQMCEVGLLSSSKRFLNEGPAADLCGYCYRPAATAYDNLGIPVLSYGNELDATAHAEARDLAQSTPLEAIDTFVWNGIAVGAHARAGALRFFARSDISNEPDGEAVLRRFLEAAILTARMAHELLRRLLPEVVVLHHGIYVPQGVVAEVARHLGIRVVTWNPAYRRHCFLFSHGDTYHYTLMDEPADTWRDVPLDESQESVIRNYLKTRWQGTEDWIRFHRDPDYSLTADIRRLGLDPAKPAILALTNVFWDAQLHYPANAFTSQNHWLLETIRYFADRNDLQLVIRIHPAELTGSPMSRQRAQDEIAAAFPQLPSNVIVVPPESPVSTYALAAFCDAALIYATKTGVELTSSGIPVIVAGEAWIRNKGITMDATSRDDYLDLLSTLPFGRRLSDETVARALRYAYHFFFRRMIPLEFVAPTGTPRRFDMKISGLADLAPGASPGLDVICSGILKGTPFHMTGDISSDEMTEELA